MCCLSRVLCPIPGLSSSSRRILYLWEVLEGFTQKQLKKFVKFAYAQERLPTTDAGFQSYPRIRMLVKPSRVKGGGQAANQDGLLPHADTCFFNVEIPDYSSLEVMRTRLETLVAMDWGMSGDDELALGAAVDIRSLLQPLLSSQPRGNGGGGASSASASAQAASNSPRAAALQAPSPELIQALLMGSQEGASSPGSNSRSSRDTSRHPSGRGSEGGSSRARHVLQRVRARSMAQQDLNRRNQAAHNHNPRSTPRENNRNPPPEDDDESLGLID